MDEIKEIIGFIKVVRAGNVKGLKEWFVKEKSNQIINILESYLKIEGFPEHETPSSYSFYASPREHAVHQKSWNVCLEQCKLALLKKLEGVEEIIKRSDLYDLAWKYCALHEDICTNPEEIAGKVLSDAIKQYLVGGE